ncbi:MAG: hypothetical protein LBE08_06205 [Bifidobacteriaceae bacterium]|nr:hypothetical protein [Bifidobacteriaceae bacterium]
MTAPLQGGGELVRGQAFGCRYGPWWRPTLWWLLALALTVASAWRLRWPVTSWGPLTQAVVLGVAFHLSDWWHWRRAARRAARPTRYS